MEEESRKINKEKENRGMEKKVMKEEKPVTGGKERVGKSGVVEVKKVVKAVDS